MTLSTDPSGGTPASRRRPSLDDIEALLSNARTLYVRRPLRNAAALVAWANASGIKRTLPPEDMHVTVAFSRAPVDWSEAGNAGGSVEVPPGGRSVEPLGAEGAVVLRFDSPDLQERWREFRDAGATWDHDQYRPHVTITYDAGGADLSEIEPYDGPLEFGPEVFQEIKPGSVGKAKAGMIGGDSLDDYVRERSARTIALDYALPDGVITDSQRALLRARAGLALDQESVRLTDPDGRMRVAVTNISKACVNPYLGREIPDSEALGLEPDKVYQLYRDPEELAKAAPTFNGVQLLRKHIPVSADDHQPWDVVGTTGTDAEFVAPYLRNSLVIWSRDAIEDVESEQKKELSCGYRYRADMTPGKIGDISFDGVMRDIVGNHVALVKDGRAGSDVVVGDSNGEIDMTAENRELAKRINAIAARTVTVGALVTYLKPRMALDAKPGAVAKALDGVTGKNFKDKKPAIAAVIREQSKGKLAKDANLDDVEKVLDLLEKHEVDEVGDESVSEPQHNAMEAAAHGQSDLGIPKKVGEEFVGKDAVENLKGFLKEKGMGEDDINHAAGLFPKPALDQETDEEKKKREEDEAKKKAAEDARAKDEKDKDMVTKPAMDAAIQAAVDATAKRVKAEVRETERAIRKAHDDVRPYVGDLAMTFDSAEEVYRHTLGVLGVPEAKTIHASALPTILGMQRKAGARGRDGGDEPRLGMDAAAADKLSKRFPGIEHIRTV